MGAVRPLGSGRPPVGRSNGRGPCAARGCAPCRGLRAAAVTLSVRHGIRRVTLEAIAIEAGIAPAQAIEHYPTLDHCLTAAFEEGTARFREAFDAALERAGSLQERMRAATAASVEELDLHPELGRFCVVEAWRCELPMLRASRLAVRRRYLETMTALGDHDSSDVRTEVMVAAGHHAASEELEQGRPEALRERLDGLIDLFEPAEPSPVA